MSIKPKEIWYTPASNTLHFEVTPGEGLSGVNKQLIEIKLTRQQLQRLCNGIKP
ncbi:MAG: hypothetical protein F6J89_27480 [Symploca sp. SIO1C4]|uniref:Uncharacterized protein n=1 Tax=Symploca sp. SIO1C4 TaxID=2607765 RepID=A0A6B3NPU9_9CYAN|nr:hypothetical protein [Symploca sp. SIO1C4]